MPPHYVDRLLGRLVLLGVPLSLASGCLGSSSCPDHATIETTYVEVVNPAMTSLVMPTLEAYQRCVDTLDCMELCKQAIPQDFVESCQRVPTKAFAPGNERVGLTVRHAAICEGRRPEGQGLAPTPSRATCEVGDWLARAAYLEGLSVPAFQRLARELAAHAAPAWLVHRANRAARDEVRHHRMMRALATRFGAVPAAVPTELPSHVRSLGDVAAENAIEGCARETLGAVVAAHQARSAADPAVRASARVIARDETEHARLAWDIHAWSSARLDASARKNVRARLEAELDVLTQEVAASSSTPRLHEVIGLPDGTTLGIVLTEMRAGLPS